MKAVRILCLVFANTVILLLLVILGAHFCINAYYDYRNATAYQRLPDVVKRSYAHMSPDDVSELLTNWNMMRPRYVPWVGFREGATKTRFVNVDAYGIRANGKAHRDISALQGAVWFFGGSTTLGWGVADEETVPARLEILLKRPVVNFGVSGYFSAQETVLLNQYLRIGYRPSMAIFLDGINESCDMTDYQEEMRLLFAKAQDGYSWDPLEFARPVTYAYGKVSTKVREMIGVVNSESVASNLNCDDEGKQNPLRAIHARFLAERDSLCRLYEIECRTFVQPFFGVHGQHDDTRLTDEERKSMRQMFDHLEGSWRKAGAIFVTNALDQYKHHAFVDKAHYSAAASELIAQAIAANLAPPRKQDIAPGTGR